MLSISTLEQLDCELPPQLANRLRASAKELQMVPEAASRALAMISQPDCAIGHFASIVEKDVSLASGILTMANSPFYSPGRPIGSIREAVIQIGFRQCHNLIQASCVNSLVKKLCNSRTRSNKILLAHSQVTAFTAVELGNILEIDLDGAEFTAGILHDIGRLLLFSLFPKEYAMVDSVDFMERDWQPDQENDALGTDHCVVGCMFAGLNSLPDPICEAIRFHHVPERATYSPLLTAITAAADDLANAIIRGDTDDYDAAENEGLSILFSQDEISTKLTPVSCAEQIIPKLVDNLPNFLG